jgi:hypothetical protein
MWKLGFGGSGMHLFPRTLLTTATILVAFGLVAQEALRSNDSDLLARLSFDDSAVGRQVGDVRHVCIAVSRNGDYRIVRSLEDGQTQWLHGKMPKEQLRQFATLLGAAEFRNLSGDHAGLIRQDAERFAAEIPLGVRWRAEGTRKWLEHKAWRLQLVNADGESPFPASVSKVIDWLQRFQPEDGESFEYAEYPDVCPVGAGVSLLHPSVASNSHP